MKRQWEFLWTAEGFQFDVCVKRAPVHISEDVRLNVSDVFYGGGFKNRIFAVRNKIFLPVRCQKPNPERRNVRDFRSARLT